MKQTGDKYLPYNLVDNLLFMLLMKQQQSISNRQWYGQFCTRADAAESVGVQFDSFRCLWDYCIEQKGWSQYNSLTPDKQATIKSESKK